MPCSAKWNGRRERRAEKTPCWLYRQTRKRTQGISRKRESFLVAPSRLRSRRILLSRQPFGKESRRCGMRFTARRKRLGQERTRSLRLPRTAATRRSWRFLFSPVLETPVGRSEEHTSE